MSLMQYGKAPVNQLIALFMPTGFYNATFFNVILQGVMEGLTPHGFGLLTIEQSPTAHSTLSKLPSSFSRGDVDGAIAFVQPELFSEFSAKLRALPSFGSRPLLLVIEKVPEAFGVTVDKKSGAAQATRHLLDLGHRHIMYINGPDDFYHDKRPQLEMYAGYREAYQASELDPDAHLLPAEIGNRLWLTGFNMYHYPELYSLDNIGVSKNNPLIRELRRHPEVTAILAPNDATALIIHHLLKHEGLRVPEDISLIGFDDTIPLCNAKWQNILTSVKLPLRQVGMTAANLIVDRITGTLATDVYKVLPTTLVVRGTTAPARAR
jgi:LacI family transcriptional regulator